MQFLGNVDMILEKRTVPISKKFGNWDGSLFQKKLNPPIDKFAKP